MSQLELALQEIGVLDIARRECARTGMSLASFIKDRLGHATEEQARTSVNQEALQKAVAWLDTAPREERARRHAQMYKACPWEDLSEEEARELWYDDNI